MNIRHALPRLAFRRAASVPSREARVPAGKTALLAASALIHFSIYLNQTILNRIFGFHTIFHNSCKFQSLSKFYKFISDFDFL